MWPNEGAQLLMSNDIVVVVQALLHGTHPYPSFWLMHSEPFSMMFAVQWCLPRTPWINYRFMISLKINVYICQAFPFMIGYYNCVYVITYSIQYTYDRMLCMYIYVFIYAYASLCLNMCRKCVYIYICIYTHLCVCGGGHARKPNQTHHSEILAENLAPGLT
jgi:hypothetical protein